MRLNSMDGDYVSGLKVYPPSRIKHLSMLLESVMEIIKETGESISEDNVDRAHRIGKKFKDKDTNEDTRGIIVRFTAFKHRTQLYKARKRLKSVRIRLDMTTKRYNILKDARIIADGNQDKVKFVYADINCRLKVHPISVRINIFPLKDILKSIQWFIFVVCTVFQNNFVFGSGFVIGFWLFQGCFLKIIFKLL